MQTLTRDALMQAQGTTVVDRDGQKIGSIEDVYYDDQTGRAEWIGIGVGIFGLKRRVVPVEGATMTEDGLQVPYDRDLVKDSPDVEGDEISEASERDLYTHYSLAGSTGRLAGGTDLGRADLDRGDTGGTRDMVRNEEELRVGTAGRRVRARAPAQVGRHRARRARRRAAPRDRRGAPRAHRPAGQRRVDRRGRDRGDPARGAARRAEGRRGTERVSLDTDVETEHETVSDEVRRERIEVEGDADDLRRR